MEDSSTPSAICAGQYNNQGEALLFQCCHDKCVERQEILVAMILVVAFSMSEMNWLVYLYKNLKECPQKHNDFKQTHTPIPFPSNKRKGPIKECMARRKSS